MNNSNIQLEYDCIGQQLKAVYGYFFDDAGSSMKEGIVLDLENSKIAIQALTDTSELFVHAGTFEAFGKPEDKVCYSEKDLSQQEPFSGFIGKTLRNWWSMKNESEYTDGFTVAFEANSGLSFIAMNNEVSVLSVAGEQMS